jgi:hypothetical protein
MAKNPIPTPEELRQLLRYEPETGKLFWRERGAGFTDRQRSAFNGTYAGKEALACVGNHGYRCGTIIRRNVLAHRIAWAIHFGVWPTDELDHVDGNRTNNRIANLRAATSQDNKKNRAIRSDNKSGATGIDWRPREKLWAARLAGKSIGYFRTKDEAIVARKSAEVLLGYSERHGI